MIKRITILGFDYAVSIAIAGVMDLFSAAGVAWNTIQGIELDPFFQVEIATIDGQPVRCINQMEIQAHKSISDVKNTDLLLIPSIGGNIEKVLERNQILIPWLQELHQSGVHIASNCTGAFFLAEAGLLDGKVATTHWGYVDLFRKRYPKVTLKPEQLLTTTGNLFCSGGGVAWFDLSLYLIELYCGHEVAVECAKAYVIDMQRDSQAAYSTLKGKKYHQDVDILKVQEWMETNYQTSISINGLASQFGMSLRSLIRRFKNATAETPLGYLQAVRIEVAKKYLESGNTNIDDITYFVGYEDSSSFKKLFKKKTGLSPRGYRLKFQKRC
jgi:transcriptional regulator GlxA family with amidase domain